MKFPTLLLILVPFLGVEASDLKRSRVKGLRGLKVEEGDTQDNTKQQALKREGQQQGGKQQQSKQNNPKSQQAQEDRTFGPDKATQKANKVMLLCLSDNLESNPLSEVNGNGLVSCTDSLGEDIIVPSLRRWDTELYTEELTGLLNCLGESVGCQDRQGDDGDNATATEPLEQGGFFDCLSDALKEEPASLINATSNAMDCVSLSNQPLEELLTCIGDSVGCQLDETQQDKPEEVLPDPLQESLQEEDDGDEGNESENTEINQQYSQAEPGEEEDREDGGVLDSIGSQVIDLVDHTGVLGDILDTFGFP